MPLAGVATAAPVVAACAVLMWSGLEKVRDRSLLAATLAGLGAAPGPAAMAAVVVPVAELGAVAAVVAGAPSYVPALLFIALGGSFAAAAAWAMSTGRVVACACFGTPHRTLGWLQVAAVPLWAIAGWAALELPEFTFRERAGCFAVGALVLAAVRAIPVIRASIEARGDRRAVAGA
jgi:hypothetical protein